MKIHDRLAKHVIVDGFPIVADTDNSHGSWVVNKVTGKEYLDCYSMHAGMPLGWNHPTLISNIAILGMAAINKIANSDCYTEYYADFVDAFAKITPDFDHYFFIDGGALAVENALKAAFDYKSKKLFQKEKMLPRNGLDVIYFWDAFHGRSGYTLSITCPPSSIDPKIHLFPKFSWCDIQNPAINLENVEETLEKSENKALNDIERRLRSDSVAAIIIEPIQGEGGDNHFRKEFFEGLKALADEYDAMLIFDEIQTGVGVTGKMWCYEHFDVKPDMLVFGKKTQVAGFCSNKKIDQVSDNVFNVSGRINSTWGGNIVDMVRATIIFNVIEKENLVQNAAEVGDYFLNRLKELNLDNARGRGLMIAFDHPERDKVFSELSEKVLCLKCGKKSIRFRPHLTFSKQDADVVYDAIKAIV